MAEYWIVSAPGKPTPEDAFGELTTQLGSHALCQRFNIPDLKVNYIYILRINWLRVFS